MNKVGRRRRQQQQTLPRRVVWRFFSRGRLTAVRGRPAQTEISPSPVQLWVTLSVMQEQLTQHKSGKQSTLYCALAAPKRGTGGELLTWLRSPSLEAGGTRLRAQHTGVSVARALMWTGVTLRSRNKWTGTHRTPA